jgi:hypothetical protein
MIFLNLYQGDKVVNVITPKGVYAANRGFSTDASVSGMANRVRQKDHAPGEAAYAGEFVRGLTDAERQFFKTAGVIEAFDRIAAEKKRRKRG